MAVINVSEIVQALGGGKPIGPNEWLCLCPAHEDKKPSLSITQKNGRVLVRCFAGCSQQAVLSALKNRGLWPEKAQKKNRIISTYDYVDESGKLLFQVCRLEPKDFRQRRPDSRGGWTWNLKGVRRVLYNLPKVLKSDTVFIVEGEKDSDRLAAEGLTGTTAPGGAGKWRDEYSQALKGKTCILLPDNDEPGRRYAEQVAESLKGKAKSIKILELPGLPEKGDVTDWLELGHTGEDLLKLAENQAESVSYSIRIAQKTAAHLATLSPFEYERQRISMAKNLGIRTSVLDAQVEKIRRASSPEKQKNLVEELEPWPEPVSGADLLNLIYGIILDYVVMPEKSATAFSLWALLTYCYDAFRILPILEIKSPEKRCGKTRLLEVLSGLACRAFPSCNLTSATVYRVIEKCRPCFLIDEADTFLPQNDELRGVLNSGHTVKTAFVTRINPDTMEPERFSTWCPKAIALIGKLPSTLDDRAIVINLKRKTRAEKVKRLGLDFDDQYLDLRRKCLRWATDNMACLKAAKPSQLPFIDNDRALDNWSPLIAIADLAGGEWPAKARGAMREIEAAREDDSARVMLLKDIQTAFENEGCERLWSQDLIAALVAMEDRPWSEWKRGKPLSKVSLSRLLRPFGITPGTVRIGDKTAKGYRLEQFADAFERYLTRGYPFSNVTTSQPAPDQGLSEYQNVTEKCNVTLSNPSRSAWIKGCDVVTDQKGGEGVEDKENQDLEVFEV